MEIMSITAIFITMLSLSVIFHNEYAKSVKESREETCYIQKKNSDEKEKINKKNSR